MNKLFLFVWQLPQNIIGALLIKIYKADLQTIEGLPFYWTAPNFPSGISLGKYRILKRGSRKTSILHEYGHSKQSLFLGPLYLLLVGFPSITRNIYGRIRKKDDKWYYGSFPENWADKLGEVSRG